MSNVPNPHWQSAIERINIAAEKCIDGEIDGDEFDLVVQSELEAAFSKGYNKAMMHSPPSEDMGQ